MSKDFIFDTNKIKKNIITEEYNVNYYMYNDDGKKDKKFVWVPDAPQNCTNSIQLHGACFSVFLEKYLEHDSVNRLYYKVDKIPIEKYEGEFEKIIDEYVKLCVKHRFLPKYTNIDEAIKNQTFVLKLDESLPIKHAYVYLCIARFIKEQPYLVKALVYLVNVVGMNIYAAIVVASATTVGESVHNFIRTVVPYLTPVNYINNGASIRLSTIIGLKWLLENPAIIGIDNEVFERSRRINNKVYRTGDFIENILKNECIDLVAPKELLNRNVISVINSKDKTILKQRLETYFKTKNGKKITKKPVLKKKIEKKKEIKT